MLWSPIPFHRLRSTDPRPLGPLTDLASLPFAIKQPLHGLLAGVHLLFGLAGLWLRTRRLLLLALGLLGLLPLGLLLAALLLTRLLVLLLGR